MPALGVGPVVRARAVVQHLEQGQGCKPKAIIGKHSRGHHNNSEVFMIKSCAQEHPWNCVLYYRRYNHKSHIRNSQNEVRRPAISSAPCCQNLANIYRHFLTTQNLGSYSDLITLYTQTVFTKSHRTCNITAEMKDNEGSDSKSIIRKYFRSTLFRERSKSFRQFESYVEYKMQQMGFKVMNPAKGQNVLF